VLADAVGRRGRAVITEPSEQDRGIQRTVAVPSVELPKPCEPHPRRPPRERVGPIVPSERRVEVVIGTEQRILLEDVDAVDGHFDADHAPAVRYGERARAAPGKPLQLLDAALDGLEREEVPREQIG